MVGWPDLSAICGGSWATGVWRSLVARVVRDDEVAGSNPVTPTSRRPPPLRRGPSSSPGLSDTRTRSRTSPGWCVTSFRGAFEPRKPPRSGGIGSATPSVDCAPPRANPSVREKKYYDASSVSARQANPFATCHRLPRSGGHGAARQLGGSARCGRACGGQRDHGGEQPARVARLRVGHQWRRRRVHPGVRDADQREPGETVEVQDRHRRGRLPRRPLPARLVPGQRRPEGRDDRHLRDDGDPAAELRAHRRDDRRQSRRLRQLERVGVMECAGRCDIRRLHRQAHESRRRRGEPHRLRRARRRRRLRSPGPDLGHDLAGLQPLRRVQRLRLGIHRRERPEAQLQPSVHHSWRRPGGLALHRRIPHDPLARAQRLRRQLHDGPRHRPPTRRNPRASGIPLGRARRVLVAGAT